MTTLTLERMREIMDKPENIRNISIMAHRDHGKSSLSDYLFSKAGIITNKIINDAVYAESQEEEKEKSISIKSTFASLCYECNSFEKVKKDSYLINLINSPGNVDFSSEITSILRATDGALLLIDCVEGVCIQIETELRQALTEMIKPALMINKIDRQILELQVDAEEMYLNFNRVIELTNLIISNYQQPDMGDLLLYPNKGNVAFGSAKEGWAFTLTTFARIYSKKFNIDMEKIREKLWGDNYYDPKSKKWFKDAANEEGEALKRAFCAFIMDPIIKLSRSIMEGNMEQMNKLLTAIEISLSDEERELPSKPLLKLVMSRWINAADTLLEMVVLHLPSPKVAQKYRVKYLYESSQDDGVAASFRDCNPKGPLMVYVFKMAPIAEKGKFIAFGRVFGGTIAEEQKVRIMGPEYKRYKKVDLYLKTIKNPVVLMGKSVEYVPDVPCGNIIGLIGIDQYLVKTGTISDNENACCIRGMLPSVSSIVRVSVVPKKAADLPQLIEGLKKLAKSDPLANIIQEESGCHTISGCSEQHVETCLNDLRLEYINCEIEVSDPFVVYKETVSEKSSQICFTKSQNKRNRFFLTAEPLGEAVTDLIEKKGFGPNVERKERVKILCDGYGWENSDALKIWAFGPEGKGANVLVDMTKGVQELNDIKDPMISGFQWASREGVLMEENMRSIRINIHDVAVHPDRIYGRVGIITATRRGYLAAELIAEPRIQEPIYLTEITAEDAVMKAVHHCLNQRRGIIIEEKPVTGTSLIKIKAYLPVGEAFGNFLCVCILV